jgi:hypothetical protein
MDPDILAALDSDNEGEGDDMEDDFILRANASGALTPPRLSFINRFTHTALLLIPSARR